MALTVTRLLIISLFLVLLPRAAWSANWEICDLIVKVQKPSSDDHLLFTEIVSVKAKAQAECPQAGEALNFDPETEDYQSMIPRKNWPKPGKTVSVRYRYLDGICKNTGPCRIRHFSLIKK